MTKHASLAPLLERFFIQRLMQQRQASPHTIDSYRDTFRQLLKFAERTLHKPPSRLNFAEVDAPLIVAFLNDLKNHQGISVRSRNLRLTAIHSFFRYAAFEAPEHSAQIQRVLAIPSKRFTRTLVNFLTRPEVDALLAAPDRSTWSGRRDHAFLLVAVQTGLRLSEITGLKRDDFLRHGRPPARHWQRVQGTLHPVRQGYDRSLEKLAERASARRREYPVSQRQRRAAERSWRSVYAEQTPPDRFCHVPVAEWKTRHCSSSEAHYGHGPPAGGRRSRRHRSVARP